MQGYKAALKRYAIPFDSKLVIECSNNNAANLALLKKLFTKKNRPDGVFASVEKLAIPTYYVCNEIKLKILQQLKVVSFSNLRTASLLSPALTTITQPAFKVSREASQLLFRLIEKKKELNGNEKIVLQSSLIQRKSSAGR